ncbi:MAG: GIY-YIG nuclease family protein [Candidatus Bathyarchaeia archaeon]
MDERMKGIYVLLMSVSKNIIVEVGALGNICFEKGIYTYVGSAQRNLDRRLKRHFQAGKRKFWHIDYLVANVNVYILKSFYKEAEKPEECIVAQRFSKVGSAVKNFGCSDCRCKSHLFKFDDHHIVEDLCLNMGFRPFTLSNHRIEKHRKLFEKQIYDAS